MTTQTTAATQEHPTVRRTGMWCLAAGLVGVAQAVLVVLWPEQVAADRYSYPFTPTGHVVAQATFFLQHLPLLAGLVALSRLAPVRTSRVARPAAAVAVVGMGLLTVMELVNMAAADAATDSSLASTLGALYGLPTVLVGVGLLVTGWVALRGPGEPWSRAPWLRLVVLLTGVYVFFPLTPGIMGPFLAGRAAIGGWMLLFAALGFGLARLGGVRSSGR